MPKRDSGFVIDPPSTTHQGPELIHWSSMTLARWRQPANVKRFPNPLRRVRIRSLSACNTRRKHIKKISPSDLYDHLFTRYRAACISSPRASWGGRENHCVNEIQPTSICLSWSIRRLSGPETPNIVCELRTDCFDDKSAVLGHYSRDRGQQLLRGLELDTVILRWDVFHHWDRRLNEETFGKNNCSIC
jgi:hypothetical protein